MAFQFSTSVRNAALDSIETVVGTSPVIEIRTGAAPANCAAADSGSLLATIPLPSNWMADASGGTKSLAGTWEVAASGTGTAGHWRLKSSGGTVHAQGSITATGGGGDMTIANTSIAASQTVTVTAFTLTAGGA